MKSSSINKKLKQPIGVYVLVIVIIAAFQRFFSPDLAISFAAALMFSAPFILKSEVIGLRWNTKGVLLGLAISLVILVLYVSVYIIFFDSAPRLNRISYTLIATQFFWLLYPKRFFSEDICRSSLEII